MNGPVIFTTLDFDQPWTLENYLKVGGYQALRKILTNKTTPEEIIAARDAMRAMLKVIRRCAKF